jgi:ferrochelatase
MTTAIVLTNLGGPDSLEAIEPYLYNIFSDPDVIQLPLGFLWQKAWARKIAHRRAPESQANYAKIGGRSPILDNTRAQAQALEAALGPGFRTYIAMRAWHPFTDEAVDALVKDGADRVVHLPMYPHRSRAVTGSSENELRRVLRDKAPRLPVFEVCCYPEAPGFIDAWVDRVAETLATLPENRRAAAHVVFSAHGLPQKLVDSGDPYLAHVQGSVRRIMERFPGMPHTLAFQSKATRSKWLEPATEHALAELARQGVRDALVVPISFLTEHVETLFELDMLIKDMAVAAGLEGYHRVRAPGDHPRLVAELAGQVQRALKRGALQPCGLPGPGCPMAAGSRS